MGERSDGELVASVRAGDSSAFVTDVDALHAELVERNARIVEPPEDRA